MVFLDEPTAALDPKAEAALIEKFAEITRGKTSVVISHRLGTARIADRILVMKDGTLVEQGPHEELLARGGEYSRMFLAQAQWYA